MAVLRFKIKTTYLLGSFRASASEKSKSSNFPTEIGLSI